nr:receptor-like protein kinase 2.33 [Ipomoea batatas]GMD47818.1 receptor-like protein kinase 2.33 [Ipomoea batatas]
MEATACRFLIFLSLISAVCGVTDPNDLGILNDLRKGLKNPELLKWPAKGDDPCGPPTWPHLVCSGGRVEQISVMGLGLEGPLPQNLNGLSKLTHLSLQNNKFSGKLPSLSGLSELQYAYLDFNRFDTIPSDFFDGVVNLQVLALDGNPLNATNGWLLPNKLQDSAQLTNLTLMNCNLGGPLPEFLGSMASLEVLLLSMNRLSGPLPESFRGSMLKMLWLNDQSGHLDLNNNHFMGPMPKFKAQNVTMKSNPFCQTLPGASCAPEVMALLQFLDSMNYPLNLVDSWSGNDPCGADWRGVSCDANHKVSIINLPKFNLSGSLSPSIANLSSLARVFLESNNISGSIPKTWTGMKSLVVLDLRDNNLLPPVPHFSDSVKLVLSGNSLLNSNHSGASSSRKNDTSSRGSQSSSPSPSSPSLPHKGSNSGDEAPYVVESPQNRRSDKSKIVVIVAPLACFVILVFLALPLSIYAFTGKVTTKADVFSFGVVLMELLTGLMALDQDRPEESQYLVSWFWNVNSSKDGLFAAIDPALDAKQETLESISTIAELACHCTAREPNQRPDMGHAVSVLSPLVEKWKPLDDDTEEYCGIDYSLPLNQMVKGWQEAEGKDSSSIVDLDDSKGSIPARPTGFAESFTSADGR